VQRRAPGTDESVIAADAGGTVLRRLWCFAVLRNVGL